jgi:hypothetical protein
MKMFIVKTRPIGTNHRLIARLPRSNNSFHMTMMLVTMEHRASLSLPFTGLAYSILESLTLIGMVAIF